MADIVAATFLELYDKSKLDPDVLNIEEISDLFRELRKLCATDVEFRKKIFHDFIDLDKFKDLLTMILKLKSSEQDNMLSTRIGLQVIGNSVVQNEVSSIQHIWNGISNFVLTCLEYQDEKMNVIILMIVYNVYKSIPNTIDEEFVRTSIIEQSKVENEFAIFFLDDILYCNNNDNVFVKFITSLSSVNQIYVIEYLKSNIKPDVHLDYFIQLFNTDVHNILNDKNNDDNSNDVHVTIFCIELLSDYSASELYQTSLQNNKSFVINVLGFLKGMHLQGKQNNHRFTPDQDLRNMFTPNEDIVFGLKATLVKLVANLCWSNPINQNLVNDMDCFPVLLECCNLDAKNPLIKEWAIFAIRNCCANNPTNQSIIANLKGPNPTIDVSSEINLSPGVNIAPLKPR